MDIFFLNTPDQDNLAPFMQQLPKQKIYPPQAHMSGEINLRDTKI